MQFICQSCKPQNINQQLSYNVDGPVHHWKSLAYSYCSCGDGRKWWVLNSLFGFKGKLLTACTLIFLNTDPGRVSPAAPRPAGHLKRHAASAASSFGRLDQDWCCSVCPMSILNLDVKCRRAGRATRARCFLGRRPAAGVSLMWLIKVFPLTQWLLPTAWPDWTSH